jgi:hypothetical protein
VLKLKEFTDQAVHTIADGEAKTSKGQAIKKRRSFRQAEQRPAYYCMQFR